MFYAQLDVSISSPFICHLSDDMAMYDEDGRCLRGSSALEGYHRWFNQIFKAGRLSEDLADTLRIMFNDEWVLLQS